MLCGPHFLHIYAGHLSNLCTLVWVPLLFFAIDRMFETSSPAWVFPGILAVAMQVLAGHIQYVFYTGVAACLYVALLLIRSNRRLRFSLLFSGAYLGGLLLSAVQFLPAIQAVGECVRASGVSFEFASMFSFPPENLLTWLVPGLFGDMKGFPYWGRCYLWEMSLFFSVTGFALALYAVAFVKKRAEIELSIVAIVLLLLALGSHMPWFHLFYDHVPGFDRFRSTSKFICQATAILIMLSATGMHDILAKGCKRPRSFALTAIFLAFAATTAAACVQTWPPLLTIWKYIMNWVATTGESYLPMDFYLDPEKIKEAGAFAARGLYIFAGTCLSFSLVTLLSNKKPKLAFLFVVLATVELLFFALTSKDTFHMSQVVPESVSAFLAGNEEDSRVLMPWSNATMLYGGMEVWGCDPCVLKRYAEFVGFTQGLDPDKVTQYMPFNRYHPLFDLLRCKYEVSVFGGDAYFRQLSWNTMRRVSLIHNWSVVNDRNAAFQIMGDPAFNPRELVVLENTPDIPGPESIPAESDVKILDSSTDRLTIEARTASPTILLVTDAFSEGWRARPLESGPQESYDVIPADYAFQGIPLKPGRHKIELEYLPWQFRLGEIVSLLSLALFILGAVKGFLTHTPSKDSQT